MKNIFESSIENRAVINIWDDKETVWRSLLRKSSWFSRAQWIYQDAPIIVNIVKFILKITVVLSVTMVIYYGVKFMLQVFKWDDLKSATAKKDLINLFIWLLIALFSITAVTLVISIPKSTLNDISFILGGKGYERL